MIIGSHLLIAKYIHQYILDELGCELNLSALKYGSILPDIKKSTYKVPHRYKDSIHMLDGIQTNLLTVKHSLNEFSIQLGVISHFIADYFCLYHFDDAMYHLPIKQHIQYELNLHKILKMYLNYQPTMKEYQQISTLDGVIERAQNQYANEIPDYLLDIRYALNTICVYIRKLIEDYIEVVNVEIFWDKRAA